MPIVDHLLLGGTALECLADCGLMLETVCQLCQIDERGPEPTVYPFSYHKARGLPSTKRTLQPVEKPPKVHHCWAPNLVFSSGQMYKRQPSEMLKLRAEYLFLLFQTLALLHPIIYCTKPCKCSRMCAFMPCCVHLKMVYSPITRYLHRLHRYEVWTQGIRMDHTPT